MDSDMSEGSWAYRALSDLNSEVGTTAWNFFQDVAWLHKDVENASTPEDWHRLLSEGWDLAMNGVRLRYQIESEKKSGHMDMVSEGLIVCFLEAGRSLLLATEIHCKLPLRIYKGDLASLEEKWGDIRDAIDCALYQVGKALLFLDGEDDPTPDDRQRLAKWLKSRCDELRGLFKGEATEMGFAFDALRESIDKLQTPSFTPPWARDLVTLARMSLDLSWHWNATSEKHLAEERGNIPREVVERHDERPSHTHGVSVVIPAGNTCSLMAQVIEELKDIVEVVIVDLSRRDLGVWQRNNTPDILLYGPAGAGKTSFAEYAIRNASSATFWSGPVQVFVFGSIAGGTGSGLGECFGSLVNAFTAKATYAGETLGLLSRYAAKPIRVQNHFFVHKAPRAVHRRVESLWDIAGSCCLTYTYDANGNDLVQSADRLDTLLLNDDWPSIMCDENLLANSPHIINAGYIKAWLERHFTPIYRLWNSTGIYKVMASDAPRPSWAFDQTLESSFPEYRCRERIRAAIVRAVSHYSEPSHSPTAQRFDSICEASFLHAAERFNVDMCSGNFADIRVETIRDRSFVAPKRPRGANVFEKGGVHASSWRLEGARGPTKAYDYDAYGLDRFELEAPLQSAFEEICKEEEPCLVSESALDSGVVSPIWDHISSDSQN